MLIKAYQREKYLIIGKRFVEMLHCNEVECYTVTKPLFMTRFRIGGIQGFLTLNMINELYFQKSPLNDLIKEYEILGMKINKFIQYVESSWK